MASTCSCQPVSRIVMAAAPCSSTTLTMRSIRFLTSMPQSHAAIQQGRRYPPIYRPAMSLPSATRFYHSRFHAPFPTHEYTNSQSTILAAALDHIPVYGFTKDALIAGARDMGFLDVSIQLFTRQEMDLVLYWLASRRGLLRAKVQNGLFDGKQLSVDEKIKILVMERLRMNGKIAHRWQDALALMSFPTNIPLSLSELHSLSSDILYLAGDASVDSSWYTKRLSLSTIYASAEVMMIKDRNPNFAATENFVDRRFEDSQAIGQKLSDVKSYMGFMAGTAVSLGRSWGLKI